MKNPKLRRLILIILILILVASIVGIVVLNLPKKPNVPIDTPITKEVESVEISRDILGIMVGEDEQLSVTVIPDDATNKSVTWSSSDESIVTVDDQGNLKALSTGKAKISVTSTNGKTAICEVTVVTKEVAAKNINASIPKTEIYVGEEISIKTTLTPSDATSDVTYTSDNSDVALVDTTGKIRGVTAGKAIITISSDKKSVTISINVKEVPKEVEKVEIRETLGLKIGETYDMAVSIYPDDATDKTLTWTSSDIDVAEVDSTGGIFAKGVGKATITVIAKNGKFGSCLLTVTDSEIRATAISVKQKTQTISVGQTVAMNATLTPSNATSAITYQSKAPKIATVDEEGKIKGVAPGTAVITAASNGKSVDVTITVIQPVTSVILNKSSTTIIVNKNETLTATVKPDNATNKTVTWASNNTKIAEVDSTGKVTAKAVGTATITATSGGKTASCSVTVKTAEIKVTKIDLANSGNAVTGKTLTLNKNETLALSAVVTPTNASNKNVKWTSNNTSYAEVDAAGKVTAKAPGTAVITATALDGSGVSATVTIKVTNFKEVTFTLSSASLTFSVKSGVHGEGSEQKAVTVSGDKTKYTYKLANGGYQYTVSGDGYYKYIKIFSIDDSKDNFAFTVIPGKKAGTGWEASTIYAYSDQYNKAVDVSSALKAAYNDVFTTPSFSSNKKKHEFSNDTDVDNFIKGLDGTSDNLYYYITGDATRKIPVVIFSKTSLKSCTTLDCALGKLKSATKLNIMYQAQIHGNEPASGEAALAMIKALDSEYGNSILDKANVVIIPRYNPTGAQRYIRNNSGGTDLNRNQLYVSTKEVQSVHNIYNILLPEVTVDGHEYEFTNTIDTEKYSDMQLGIDSNLNNTSELNTLAKKVLNNLMAKIKAKGLYPDIYGTYVNTPNITRSRPYYGLYGSISIVVETKGKSKYGKELWERRVLNQYITVEQYFNYVVDNATEIKKTVTDSRNKVIELGKKYNSSNMIILEQKTTTTNQLKVTIPVYSFLTGARTLENRYYSWYDQVGKTRVRPTAYVISKDSANAATVIEKLNYNGIKCYSATKGSSYNLMQYSGSGTTAQYGSVKKVTFTNGAYVCTMNQVGANILAVMMEPDVNDVSENNGTFVQKGILAASEIYRSHSDLVASTASDAINGMKLPTVK